MTRIDRSQPCHLNVDSLERFLPLSHSVCQHIARRRRALRRHSALQLCLLARKGHGRFSCQYTGSCLRPYFTPSYLRWVGYMQPFELGQFGVGVFFLISGFVIPFSLLGRSAVFRRWATDSNLSDICGGVRFHPRRHLDLR